MTDLLDQILANPYDDAPRLVYADQLLERGDPRGELILLQCTPNHDKQQVARHVELRKQLAWEVERTTGLVVHFDRGFMHTVTGTIEQIVAARALLEREPVQELHVEPGDLQPLFDMPLLDRIVRFVVRNEGTASFDDAAATQLATCDRFRSLRELEIHANKLRAPGLRALGNAPWLARLRSLIVRTNPLGVAGLRAMPHMPALTALELTSIQIPLEREQGGFAELCAAVPSCESLRIMMGAPLRGAGIRELAASSLPHLERLDLFANRLDGEIAVLATAGWPSLRRLRLERCGLRDPDVAALATAAWSLHELDVSDNYIRDHTPIERAFPDTTITRSST